MVNLRNKVFAAYFNFALQSKGGWFQFLFNAQNIILKKPGRIKIKSNPRSITLTELGITRAITSERVAVTTYWKGLQNRARGIANSYFLDLVTIQPGDTIVDCGANVGDLELYFRMNNLPVNYLAFEPSPPEFECLKKNIQGGLAHNMGLWDQAGQIPFYISTENSDSSFIEPPSYTDIKLIKTARLDTLINEEIAFLKVEAEGGEPEVIRGCEGILSKIKWISVDVGFERGKAKESTFIEVNNYLLSRNFILDHFISPSGRYVALFKNKDK